MFVLGSRLKELKPFFSNLVKKVWLFPLVLLLFVFILGLLQIHGSSIGIYQQLLYGENVKDSNLLFNEPRSIRSDEWLVTTQLSIAQTENEFKAVNDNIGNGIDISLLVDAPTRDAGQLFKPHNLGFFVFPAEIAFALKWWLLAYLLVISVYFFVLALMPRKIGLAILLSLGFLASPFIAWWYQYITLAPIYYALFGIVVSLKIIYSRNLKASVLWGLLLAYLITSFALVLYPPFQIPCALFAAAFLIGYVADNKKLIGKNRKNIVLGSMIAFCLGLLLTVLCLAPKMNVIQTIANTAYPGNRLTESGGYNLPFFLSSHTSLLVQSNSRAGANLWIPNQSEGSHFMLVFILLLPILAYFAIKYRRKVPNFWMIVSLLVLTTLFIAWLFIPNIDLIGKATLLNRVLHARLLIGFGLINLLAVVLFIIVYQKNTLKLPKYTSVLYPAGLLIGYCALNLYIANKFPGFMGEKIAVLLALPYPFIIYLLLRRHFKLALAVFAVFSFGSVIFIHPLYVGLDPIRNSELSRAIKSVDDDSKKWVTDSLQLENLAVVNGKKSLSGVYVYPDTSVWKDEFSKDSEDKYNRYAHVHFQFDRNESSTVKPKLVQPSPDQLIPTIEPCDLFLQKNNVGYIMTTQEFNKQQAPCAQMIRHIGLPKANVYIYKLDI